MSVPGPAALGRSVVINTHGAIPAPWAAASVITVGEDALAAPASVVARLHRAWTERESVVIELAVDPARFRRPQSIDTELWRLAPGAEPWFDRLHFLVWNNAYDARTGSCIWWWARKAERLGASPPSGVDGADPIGDVLLPDGSAAWLDGGPRRPWGPDELGGLGIVHHESLELGRLPLAPNPGPPQTELAPDQAAAVGHLTGAARIVAPAGSGKTRVLTERLRHLMVDREWERESVLAVAYNKEAQLELERRTTTFRPRVRTLNSLGLWILTQYHGRSPGLLEERETRRLVDSLLPGRRQHRANTDPIGPYLEALGLVRLGLRDPAEVEESRDDVEGLSQLFAPYRAHLAERGAVDFDGQIYGAVEALWRDGEFRRSMQQHCRHLLVDEFQDLTPAHVMLVRLLALPALDVFGVGDDDQCIYHHAGADPAFLIDYADLFPGAASHPLTVNYRCPAEVVEGARTLLGYNHRRVAKEIGWGPEADTTDGALAVVQHGPDDAAQTTVAVIRDWLAEAEVDPSSIAVLTRVNSLLLAPQVALVEAAIPVRSVLSPAVLERTGLRAALAYLRLAVAGDAMAPADIVEILRRPTRGLPQWFPDRLGRRSTWSVKAVEAIADQVPDKESAKVLRLAGDLRAVIDAARRGTTRQVLEVVRDDVGLGSAMTLLDRTGAAQGSSHLDDLEGLLGVADLHPDPAGFEPWLRTVFGREADPDGVLLSTIHRVKGREWDRVVVFGVSDGVVPHRLSDNVEEERRVLHVGITRGRHRVTVLGDRTRRSPFLAELAGTAARKPARSVRSEGTKATVTPRPKASKAKPQAVIGIEAAEGRELRVLGGYGGTVEEAHGRGVRLRLETGGTLDVRYGERVEHDGTTSPLAPPVELWGEALVVEGALRAWRTARAKADTVPPYVVLSDAHLRGIALARPATAEALLACDGIGPTKLERYGDEILAQIDTA